MPAKAKQHKGKKGHPWRDNIEALTVSVVLIVLFKYFVLEAYKIPTGSMQPTLMGWQERDGTRGISDRVLVNKLAYHHRDPDRFEIVVFKYPLDRSKNFIKRLWGMPGETLELRNGDVFVRPKGTTDFAIPRRPGPVLDAMLKRLVSKTDWKRGDPEWDIVDGDIVARRAGFASFPEMMSDSVKDSYEDGYPEGLRTIVASERQGTDDKNHVADLRIVTNVEANADCTAVQVVFTEGNRRYTVEIPGPAAPADARPAIRASRTDRAELEGEALASEPLRLEADRTLSVMAQNLDDRVTLELDGEVVLELDIEAVPQSQVNRVGIQLVTEGGGGRFSEPKIWRDIYYTINRLSVTRWDIPDESYMVLGDNTQDSSDSRDWSLNVWELQEGPHAGQVVRGNNRRGPRREENNPRFVPDGVNGTRVFLRDDLGELWTFHQVHAEEQGLEASAFVHREHIRGRAVLVVWPMSPSLGVYRLKWVR